MSEKIWKEIKCKECGTQSKALFMIPFARDSNDCFCEECMEKEKEIRAKGEIKCQH